MDILTESGFSEFKNEVAAELHRLAADLQEASAENREITLMIFLKVYLRQMAKDILISGQQVAELMELVEFISKEGAK